MEQQPVNRANNPHNYELVEQGNADPRAYVPPVYVPPLPRANYVQEVDPANGDQNQEEEEEEEEEEDDETNMARFDANEHTVWIDSDGETDQEAAEEWINEWLRMPAAEAAKMVAEEIQRVQMQHQQQPHVVHQQYQPQQHHAPPRLVPQQLVRRPVNAVPPYAGNQMEYEPARNAMPQRGVVPMREQPYRRQHEYGTPRDVPPNNRSAPTAVIIRGTSGPQGQEQAMYQHSPPANQPQAQRVAAMAPNPGSYQQIQHPIPAVGVGLIRRPNLQQPPQLQGQRGVPVGPEIVAGQQRPVQRTNPLPRGIVDKNSYSNSASQLLTSLHQTAGADTLLQDARCHEMARRDFVEENVEALVTTEVVATRQVIIEMNGHVSKSNEVKRQPGGGNYVFMYDGLMKGTSGEEMGDGQELVCVDAKKNGNDSRFTRRSCIPNCVLKHVLGPQAHLGIMIVATKDIHRNVEVTLPFDADWRDAEFPLECAKHLKELQMCPFEGERRRYAAERHRKQEAERRRTEANRAAEGERPRSQETERHEAVAEQAPRADEERRRPEDEARLGRAARLERAARTRQMAKEAELKRKAQERAEKVALWKARRKEKAEERKKKREALKKKDEEKRNAAKMAGTKRKAADPENGNEKKKKRKG